MSKKIAVLGAGAVGATTGAYLLKAGHDVTLIDQWAAHIDKIRSDGLKLTDLSGEVTVPAKALHLSDLSNLREPFDIVFLSVKSYDTRWSAYLIEPHLKTTGFILPTQNALNDEVVASVVGFNRTVGCVTTISAGVYEPGHVVRTDPLNIHCYTVGELSGLISSRVKEVVSLLQTVGHSEATTNIWGTRWAKLLINSSFNALSGIIGPKIHSMNETQKDTANFIRIVTGGETARVGFALGVSIEPVWQTPAEELAEATTMEKLQKTKEKLSALWAKRYLPADQLQKKLGAPDRPSLLQDVMKKRRTEVEFLNGEVVRKGKEVGVPTPLNQAILDLTLKIENGEVDPDPAHLEQLKKHISLT
jgi:2-dehydropantoate 2-reductase